MWRHVLRFFDWIFPPPIALESIEHMTARQLRQHIPPPTQPQLKALATLPIITLVILTYRHPLVRQAIWELKYRGNLVVARLIASLVAEELVKIERYTSKNIVILPLPNSMRRRQTRGWNQTELIAHYIPYYYSKARVFTDVLKKIRDTPAQATLKNRARLTNLTNCFRVHIDARKKIGTENLIVLLDDVATTGATFAEALRPLLELGLTDICCIAIAH